MLSTIQEFEID